MMYNQEMLNYLNYKEDLQLLLLLRISYYRCKVKLIDYNHFLNKEKLN